MKFARPKCEPEIEVLAEPQGSRVRVTVADKGVGIEPQNHERIFGLFERANGYAPGTGIGLAIVKKAAERMRGSVGLNCKIPGRTEFWIELERGDVK